MACQAESERYLNVVPVVHGGGVANIRLRMTSSAGRSAIMESPSAWASLGDGGKNGSQSSRSATTIEDMFSARDKSRPDSPARNAYRTIRGGRVVRSVLRSREFEDRKVAESSTIQARCGLPKADQIPLGLGPAGRRLQDAGCGRVARTCDGDAGFQRPSRSGRPVADLTGYVRGRHEWRPSSLFPRLGESFRR
jgi:hypothetical protein